MSKISNVLTMLQLLQSGRKYNINELSKEKKDLSEVDYSPLVKKLYKYNREI